MQLTQPCLYQGSGCNDHETAYDLKSHLFAIGFEGCQHWMIYADTWSLHGNTGAGCAACFMPAPSVVSLSYHQARGAGRGGVGWGGVGCGVVGWGGVGAVP